MKSIGLQHVGIMLLSTALNVWACPGSQATVHAQCQMIVVFDQPCNDVREEIAARIASVDWIDPHNQGIYSLLDSESQDILSGKRLSGNKKYTDLFDFTFLNLADSSGCTVEACSESQVTSILDFDTNYCNLHNLYCNSENENCQVISHELSYSEQYSNCWQRNVDSCISAQASS